MLIQLSPLLLAETYTSTGGKIRTRIICDEIIHNSSELTYQTRLNDCDVQIIKAAIHVSFLFTFLKNTIFANHLLASYHRRRHTVLIPSLQSVECIEYY